jgi:DNA polymerase-3 subunit gamma/tau
VAEETLVVEAAVKAVVKRVTEEKPRVMAAVPVMSAAPEYTPEAERISPVVAQVLEPIVQPEAVSEPVSVAPALGQPQETAEKIALASVTPEHWIPIYLELGVGGVLQSTVSNCVLVHCNGNQLSFVLDANNSTLYDTGHQQRLSDLLTQYFGEPVTATIEMGVVTGEAPAGYLTRLRQEKHARALAQLQADPIVQDLIETFDAVLDEESVTSLE